MYNKEHFDHLFYRMKKSIPTSYKLFILLSVIKLYPLFLLSHTGGYTVPSDSLSTIHTYFRYFCLSFYIQNTFSSGSTMVIVTIVFILNLLLVGGTIYYLAIAKKVKKIDENYGNVSSLGYIFYIFSNFCFFKYIILFQFFQEINFIPLLCFKGNIDYERISVNNIFSNVDTIKNNINDLCDGNTMYTLIVLCSLNFVIDIFFFWLITSRFFDFNILSEYKWNYYPNLFFSFEFLESTTQIFFILFLHYDNKKFKIIFDFYVLFILIVHLLKRFKSSDFHTAAETICVYIAEYIRIMSYISAFFIAIFQFGFDDVPNDVNVLGLVIFEGIFVFLLLQFMHRNDNEYIKNILVSSLNQLNEKNIYPTLIFLVKEFKKFSDISYKFSDNNLDLFLENYVNHLKICEDMHCPCKNYVKKVTGASNTIKSGYTTVINFTHMKKDQQEEYILNKFFNVLAANISATLKYNNNVNLNNIKDSQRQKLIYQLRLKLIQAVRKLISYKLEKLTKELDASMTNQFTKETKDFIRINFYAVNILCNKAYYKTQFLYYEFLSDYFKRRDKGYHFNLIYYFYLKMFSIKEYNGHLSNLKQGKKEHSSSGFHLDFRTVLSLCVKYYEIEERLIKTAKDYEDFIMYFNKEKIVFDKLLVLIKKFKGDYKNVTRYITHYFKNDKINNLFVCTKIILFFKILHFDIPETLHNKLIIQVHDTEESNKVHSYIDSNYYMILNYIHGEFVIKFISHELLIVLEYSEDELRDQDFHVLLPEKLRRLHKNVVISEIKSRTAQTTIKEIFFVSKRQTCVLFDIQYKFLLNLRGEITLLTVVNLKKPSKDFRVCFACIDEHGDLLALNKEFEEFLVISMKVLDYVKIDTEKLILQGMGERMRKFFKDEENTDFQEQFDYEQYISSLFDEEFEVLKEKNEKEYRKKYARWEVLKEMNRKGRYYTRYLELNIKQRCLGKEKIYFLKYSVKITVSLRSIEPHSTTLSLIHAVKISKREMAKLSFYRGDEIYESKSEKSVNEEKVNESHDDLFESQSQISSAVSQLKERNSVRLFKQKRSNFKFLPKSRNILFLMISIGVLAVISVVYNIISLIIKNNLYKTTQKILNLDLNSVFLKKNIFQLASAITSLSLMHDRITMDEAAQNKTVYNNIYNMINEESAVMNNVTYNISLYSTSFYNKKIDALMNLEETLTYIFDNGLIYSKVNSTLYQETTSIKKSALDIIGIIENNQQNSINNSNIYNYFFLKTIDNIQNTLTSKNISLSEKDTTNFFLMRNLFSNIDIFIDKLIDENDSNLSKNKQKTRDEIAIIKFFEFFLVGLIICIEWAFIYFGYEKAKKKMIHLRQKVERNNIDFSLKKIEEFIHFSNNFNIGSLYYIADLDLKKIEESNKTIDQSNTNSKSFSTLMSSQTTPRKKVINFTNNDSSFNTTGNIGNDVAFSLKEELKGSIQKPFHELPVEIDKTPQNEPDGKKNLKKVMDRLNQIRMTKKKDYEKKESEKSKQSNESSGVYNSENVNNLNFVANKESNSSIKKVSSKEGSPTDSPVREYIKPALRAGKNEKPGMALRFNVDDNIGGGLIDEDSKIPMMKGNEEGIGLIKKTTRTTKVQFKEKNVRYYSPGQNVNEAVEVNNGMKASKITKESSKDINSIINSGINNDMNVGINNNDRHRIQSTMGINQQDKSLLSAIQKSSSSLPGMSSKLRIDGRSQNKRYTGSKDLNADLQLADLKDNNQFNKYQLIEQGKAVTVKKRQEMNQKDMPKKEIIEDKIENVIHNNTMARSILNITLVLFIVIYIISIVLNFLYNTTITHASNYAHLLFNKTTLMTMITLKYKYDVIQNEHSEIIDDYINKSEENKKIISDFEVKSDPSVLKNVYKLERTMKSNSSCEYFADLFSNNYETNYEDELNECSSIGDQMNLNGLSKAESYVLSTIIVLVEDWKNIATSSTPLNKTMIITKLTDLLFMNIDDEIMYTLRKYTTLLMKYMLDDIEEIFKKIFFNENILGYFTICMNIIFLFLSLLFIVYPIKSVEMMITWLIHKIMRN